LWETIGGIIMTDQEKITMLEKENAMLKEQIELLRQVNDLHVKNKEVKLNQGSLLQQPIGETPFATLQSQIIRKGDELNERPRKDPNIRRNNINP
jgi:hypothetical protein